jgi:hypothetical protein
MKFLYAFLLISPQIGKLLIIHNMNLSIDVIFGACHLGGVCLICCSVQAIFYHKFLIPNHPPCDCTNLDYFYGKESLMEKNISATKMKENG